MTEINHGVLVNCKLWKVKTGQCVYQTHQSITGEEGKPICHSNSDKVHGLRNSCPRSWSHLLDTVRGKKCIKILYYLTSLTKFLHEL